MKDESAFNKTKNSRVPESREEQSRIDTSMTTDGDHGIKKISDVSKPGASKAGSVKPKVVPLTQEQAEKSGGDVRKRKMWILVVVLCLAQCFIIPWSLGMFSDGDEKASRTAKKSETKAEDSGPVRVGWKIPGKIGNAVRDITSKATGRAVLTNDVTEDENPWLAVRGIVVYNDKHRSAIIGDEIVTVGDTVKGVKIYEITNNSVTFEKDGVRWTRGIE